MIRRCILSILSCSTLLTGHAFADAPKASRPPAQSYVFIDVSSSSPLTDVGGANFARLTGGGVAQEIASGMMIGDTLRVADVGRPSAKTAPPLVIPITRARRPRDIGQAVGMHIAETPSKTERHQSETAIIWSLQTANIKCTAGSMVVLLTDGISTDAGVAMGAVIEGKAQLPQPTSRYLANCRISVHGLGISGDTHGSLTTTQLATLEAAWRAFFRAAGARPEDISISNVG